MAVPTKPSAHVSDDTGAKSPPWAFHATVAAIAIAGLVTATPRASQTPASGQGRPEFTARTQGVVVDVEVTRDGYPVTNLTAVDFELRDNGVVQDCAVSHSHNAPVNAVLALDVSASTKGKRLTDLVDASQTLIRSLKPGDQTSVVAFSDQVNAPVPPTRDLVAADNALTSLSASGNTALLDGIYAGLVSTQPVIGASLVVVYTDGEDTASWLRVDEVREAALRLNAVLEAVVVGSNQSRSDLKDLTSSTGGEVFQVDSTGTLSREFSRILEAFRSRYLLTYTPHGVTPGGFHEIKVFVPDSHLSVHARSGYVDDSRTP